MMSILAGALIPISKFAVKRQKELELRRDLRTMRQAIDLYKKFCDTGVRPNLHAAAACVMWIRFGPRTVVTVTSVERVNPKGFASTENVIVPVPVWFVGTTAVMCTQVSPALTIQR